MIRRSFPAETYLGKVTEFDEEFSEELREDQSPIDDDFHLYQDLKGRKWTDVPHSLLESQPDGFVLLTNEAFVAFLAAWLMYSLTSMYAENEVRNFIIYSFEHTLRQFRFLNREQRLTVRSLLAEFVRNGTVPFVSQCAAKAVALIDSCD